MILDEFKGRPGFPFPRYFDDPNDYAHAQMYWLRVLRSVPGFDDTAWVPHSTSRELPDAMYEGSVFRILCRREAKEVFAQTVSVDGHANMLLAENAGIGAEETAPYAPPGQRPAAIPPITVEEARAHAARMARVGAWVEAGAIWAPDPSHPQGGALVPTERLILTAEVSPAAEPLAIEVLELFLRPGPAAERVNARFSPPEA